MDPATAAHITNLLDRLSVGTIVQAPVAAGFFECPSCHTIHPLTVAHTPAAAAVTAAAAAVPVAAAAVPAAADVAPAAPAAVPNAPAAAVPAAADVAPAAPAAVPNAPAAAVPAAADVAPAAPAAAVPAAAVPNAAAAAVPQPAPEHPPAGSNPNGPWYAVVTGRQVGLFQDWRRVVAPLVLGVPHWDSQRFSTYAQARRHYNDMLAAGLVHIHHE
ncbi:hypothetical protein PC9H_000045 [Pleurotus ostreatus]|uniref:Ribonuclease H1 N-terminal domain-containing protein n=2 Tax=Pleurotus ostreatus TaxID=5322 RepID=A0A067N2V1_PLEO1|nr:uncharacterized protein PC9H_004367 [Pleurotus ostreatus]XP_036635553.1 uncharacterized protein PC9H_000045 [Pleurotus ostreatus]KDQ22194.1 hypothetical protein PLEOSDRAFT_1072817 [Pleurotus ostreatus PC15]KAF7437525.1 hypothetical protein PC9H_004367 [Pleurotus ostreatus]KAF7439709.1 hypothetical protein PC9H_000045 [Pleurotus ostreatus]KAJ8701134.1 hypothetical protein PTI98_004091 [Pleurotus ostreatus]KAJ8703473.1 hypothetical protein PTI98_002095 [Pleurotus ostreatus]